MELPTRGGRLKHTEVLSTIRPHDRAASLRDDDVHAVLLHDAALRVSQRGVDGGARPDARGLGVVKRRRAGGRYDGGHRGGDGDLQLLGEVRDGTRQTQVDGYLRLPVLR